MARSKKFFSGVVLGYAQQALVMVAGLWLTPFLLKRIGQFEYAGWLICMQVLAYLTLADVGVVALLPREIAYATGRAGGDTNTPELPVVVGRTARILLYQLPFLVLIVILTWFLAPVPAHFRGFVHMILVAFAVLFPLRIFRAIVEGLQDLRFMGRAQIVAWFVGTAVTVQLVLAGFGVYSVAIGWVATQFLTSSILAFRVWRRFPHAFPTRRAHFSGGGSKEYFKRGLWASVNQISTPLLGASDLLIIGKLCGAAAVVPYNCTGKLSGVLANQPQMLLELALPGLSEVKAGGTKQHILRVSSALTLASLMISGLVALVVAAVNPGFVGWWVGNQYFSGQALNLCVAANMLLRSWNNTTLYTMFCFGMERRISLMCLLDGIVTLGLSFALVAWLGPIGAPLGSIGSLCFIGLPFNLSAVAGEAEATVWSILKSLSGWFWRFLVLIVLAVICFLGWTPANFIQIAAAAAAVALVYGLAMLSMGRNSLLWPYVAPRLMPIWRTMTALLSQG